MLVTANTNRQSSPGIGNSKQSIRRHHGANSSLMEQNTVVTKYSREWMAVCRQSWSTGMGSTCLCPTLAVAGPPSHLLNTSCATLCKRPEPCSLGVEHAPGTCSQRNRLQKFLTVFGTDKHATMQHRMYPECDLKPSECVQLVQCVQVVQCAAGSVWRSVTGPHALHTGVHEQPFRPSPMPPHCVAFGCISYLWKVLVLI
jgi:hypothetical protein